MATDKKNRVVIQAPEGTDIHPAEAPTYQPWITANVAADAEWVVPPGKIYEVYAYCETIGATIGDLNFRLLAENSGGWMPHNGIITDTAYWKSTAPVREVRYITDSHISTLPRGWILSGGEGLSMAFDWVVRYRDVTEHPW